MKTHWMKRWPLGLLLAAALVCVAAMPGDKVKLRLNLKEGDSFRFKVVVDQDIRQTVMGQAQDMVQQIGMGQQFDVLSAADGVYDVKLTYYWVSYLQDGPMGRVEYDSDDPPEVIPPMAIGFAALKGRHVVMKIDALGYVQDIIGIDAMLDAMVMKFDSLGMTPPPEMKESLKQQFGDEAMKAQMENMMAIYPEEEVGIGDTWTKEVALKSGMPMTLVNTYRLVGREAGQAQIEVESIVTPSSGDPMEVGGMTLAYAISGTQQGTMVLDEANGLPVQANIAQKLSGDVTMNDSMTWPIEIESTNVVAVE